MPGNDTSRRTTGSCDRCARDIPAGAGAGAPHRGLSYRLVPAAQMDKAARGVYTPWSLHLCAACYDAEHR